MSLYCFLIESLYKNASSAVLLGGELGEFFPATVGVKQGCILSPVLFNAFLERIMQEALSDFFFFFFFFSPFFFWRESGKI